MDTGPRLRTILAEAFVRAPRQTRRALLTGLFAWIGLMALQVWDSSDTSGAPGIAEFLSALCGSAGGMLFVLGSVLEAGAEAPPAHRGDGTDSDAFRRLLIALPTIALAASSLLAAAIVLMAIRAVLGAPLVLVGVMVALFAAVLVLSARAAVRASRLLYAHARAEADAATAARAEAGEAQLAALTARMNPHFLFNALNTVAALIPTDPQAAERATENLAGVLRTTLERTAGGMSTVGDEIAYVRSYLELEQERFRDRLRVEWIIDPAIDGTPLPPLVLQPLVENALRHGAEVRLDGITIRITAAGRDELVVIGVDDDGPGFQAGLVEGTGLGDLRRRLTSIYGSRATLDVERTTPGGHVRVTVPRAVV